MWPFDDAVAALNTIYAFVTGFPGIIGAILAFLMAIFLYPIILAVNLIYGDINIIYTAAASLINVIISIPNLVSVMFTSWLPTGFPSVWTVMFLMSISLNVLLRVMRIITYVRTWIPILW